MASWYLKLERASSFSLDWFFFKVLFVIFDFLIFYDFYLFPHLYLLFLVCVK